MKSLTKRVGVFATVAAIMTTMIAGSGLVYSGVATAEDNVAKQSYTYIYDQISDDNRADQFYKAYGKLDNDGDFKDGKIEYDLIANNVVAKNDIANYVNNGDKKVLEAFGAGRDAYIMDHPDLFYADLYGTSVSAGQQNGEFVGFLDSSRVANLYLGGFNTVALVDNAIATYENKLSQIVTAAKSAGDVEAQIRYVNKYIAQNTVYSFGTHVVDGKNVEGPEAAYISTAYGSLVNGKAICGGYAKGFKAVMDRLGIPCVTVQGYSLSGGSASWQPHMWNYVEVEGLWYAVDVTWNSTGGNIEKWLLVGGQAMSDTHIEDGILSTTGYEFKYPAIKPYDFGDDTDDNGMTILGSYEDSDNGTGKMLTLEVSFDGKGAVKLQEEGKYMAVRFGDTDKETKEIKWGYWFDTVAVMEVYASIFKHTDTATFFKAHAGFEYIQFALINRAPDESFGAFYPDRPEYGENAGKICNYAYKKETFNEAEDMIGAASTPYLNNGHGSYIPAPGVSGYYPTNTGAWPVDKTYDIKVVYNTTLKLVEGANESDITLDFYTSRGNDTVKEAASVTNVKWDGDKTITFTFTPSRMYIHNDVLYYFTPTNLVGAESKKVPDPFTYVFKGKSVVCSKIFNDGRLYMNVFGEPQMLDTSDLSVTDFKDENGNYYAQNQRSQLLLVANKPTPEREQEMDEVLKENLPIKDGDIVTSATFEISLQICGVVTKVPNGSYMQVAFGFPEGFSPDDAGTTFKIYHYKHDDKGNITGVEEIPVIITEYGLIAQVKSFSPFKIVQIKKSSDAVTMSDAKNVYATVNGVGGTVSAQENSGKGGITSVTEDTVTYYINAQEHYQVGTVLLNGKAISLSRIKDGKLTLDKDELSSDNMLEVKFINKEAAKSFADRGITILAPNQVVETTNLPPGSNTGLVIGIAIGCVVAVLVATGVVVAVVLIKKKKRAQAE